MRLFTIGPGKASSDAGDLTALLPHDPRVWRVSKSEMVGGQHISSVTHALAFRSCTIGAKIDTRIRITHVLDFAGGFVRIDSNLELVIPCWKFSGIKAFFVIVPMTVPNSD